MGGGCPRVYIKEVELELGRPDSKEWWETRLENKEVEGRMLAFSDGKGWLGSSLWGAAQVGNTATVWDGQIAGMLGVVEKFEIGEKILLLADSKAAISAVKKAGKTGKARTRGNRESEVGGAVALGWVKSHIGIHGNEITNEIAKKEAKKKVESRRTPSHRRRDSSKDQEVEERCEGFGKGKVMSWARRTATNYSQLRTNKGALQAWRFKIGKTEGPGCTLWKCSRNRRSPGLACEEWRELRKEVWIEEEATARRWRDWKDLDSGNWVIKERDAEGNLTVRDLVAEFMSKIKRR